MSSFETSRWADSTFSREYLEKADHYIPDRFYLFHVLRSFYRAFVAPGQRPAKRVCDLGCGDGILTEQLLREDPALKPMLVDGSADMLSAAKSRLKQWPNLSFVQLGFDELPKNAGALGNFELIMSSFAIHHLERPERQKLFVSLFQQLEPEGWFLNIETALPDHGPFTEWYYQLWGEWIARRGQLLGHGDQFIDVPRHARENPDNRYSPLAEQLADLAAAGFVDVECHYKNGIFAIYAGRKPK